MDKAQKDLAKVIENYFGADAGYLDIDCFTLARRIMEAGWTKPVLCEECVSHSTYSCVKYGNCKVHGSLTDGNDYCSKGKRRTDG